MGVYKRGDCGPGSLHEKWNAVIDKVNEKRADPPEDTDCDPLPPIDCVDPEHVWTKSDVQAVQDAISEMRCDAISFGDIPDYWLDSIITEIEEQLEQAWCDCEEECLPDCSNASNSQEETYMGSWHVEDCSTDFTGCSPEAAEAKGSEAFSKAANGADAWREYCDLKKECEDLQDELTALEAIRDEECAKPPPNNCAAAQAAVDAKQAELDAKETERDAKLLEAEGYHAESDALAAESMSMMDAAYPHSQQGFSDWIPNIPWVDTDCELLGPWCLGQDEQRCRCWWGVSRKATFHFSPPFIGEWGWEASGSFTKSGQPMVLAIRACPGVPRYACYSTTCEDPCYPHQTYEFKTAITYPFVHPGGEECCP